MWDFYRWSWRPSRQGARHMLCIEDTYFSQRCDPPTSTLKIARLEALANKRDANANIRLTRVTEIRDFISRWLIILIIECFRSNNMLRDDVRSLRLMNLLLT
ncbi:hypothetical protein Hypma_002892 [Hypsizygus marmoreus]|uniref:Uncharacterized protein n=1 Tax=Hypsizygus marmoreus TaxID=39966 RepID=A0A369J3B4_HYPMA|nr:hypothetical protein Hypma_002892 [Hypsizygus marmoreus]